MYERINEPRKRISVGVLVGLLKRWNTQKHTLLWSWRCFKIIPSGYELAGDAESLVKQRKTAALSRLESFADWFPPQQCRTRSRFLEAAMDSQYMNRSLHQISASLSSWFVCSLAQTVILQEANRSACLGGLGLWSRVLWFVPLGNTEKLDIKQRVWSRFAFQSR